MRKGPVHGLISIASQCHIIYLFQESKGSFDVNHEVDYMALRSYAYQAVYGSFSHNVTSLKGSFDS